MQALKLLLSFKISLFNPSSYAFTFEANLEISQSNLPVCLLVPKLIEEQVDRIEKLSLGPQQSHLAPFFDCSLIFILFATKSYLKSVVIPTAPSHRCLDPFTKSCGGCLKIGEVHAIRLPLLNSSSAGSCVEN